MGRVNFFELGADDLQRAIKFYQDAFGWQIKEYEGQPGYFLITTGPKDQLGIDGAITRRQFPQPCVPTVGVASLDETLAKITAAGGKIVQPKMTIPMIGDLAYCQDTEGTVFGVIQPLPMPQM
jgi:uncharacterized protein